METQFANLQTHNNSFGEYPFLIMSYMKSAKPIQCWIQMDNLISREAGTGNGIFHSQIVAFICTYG